MNLDIFRFLREKCDHRHCDFTVVDSQDTYDMKEGFYASNHGTSIPSLKLEKRFCKHCESIYDVIIKLDEEGKHDSEWRC